MLGSILSGSDLVIDFMLPNSREETEDYSLPFPVVGIGASAGGLEAIRELIGEIPVDSRLALLVVMHLDPQQPSHLVEILGRASGLKAVIAEADLALQAGHLYVIPPATSMSVVRGRIQLRARDDSNGPAMPVDDLLDSLAADQRSNAIGVVLSGSGSDGAIGLQRVKDCGGTTFAQDEQSALFGSMPRAAVSLGCVDLALPPSEIGQELARLASHPYLVPRTEVVAEGELLPDEALEHIVQLLQSTCGVDFSDYKRATLERRIARRLALQDAPSTDGYVAMLQAEPAEAFALCGDLLIKYTRFFRDPEAFEALTDTVFPRILKESSGSGPVRVWVPGCSTGEEVYSIGMVLTEYLERIGRGGQFHIFATDLSEEALETARAGRYIENVERDISPARVARFFNRDGAYFRVVKSLRECCTFARQNVVYDPPFSRMHLVSCRNVLIYMNATLQRRVFPSFHFALLPQGALMLGMSESIGTFAEFFTPIETKRGRIFAKKPLAPAGGGRVVPLRLRASADRRSATALAHTGGAQTAPAPDTRPSPSDRLRAQFERILLDRYSPACVLCDEDLNVLEYRGDTSAFLSNPPGPPTHQLRRLARPELLLAVGEAMAAVRRDGTASRRDRVRVVVGGESFLVSLEVVPVKPAEIEGRWYGIVFQRSTLPGPSVAQPIGPRALPIWQTLAARLQRTDTPPDPNLAEENARLKEELRATREQVHHMLEEHERALEELKAMEEETLSSNEEFQSTNEELESAKESQQAINEELATTNDELRYRNRELHELQDTVTQARDYADAVLETMAEPLVVLDQNLRVSRANPAFYETFRTTPRDTLHCELYRLGSHQWDVPALRTLLEEMLPNRTQIRDFELSAELPGVGRRSLRVNARRVAWPEHSFILMTFEDVTERDQALRELTESGRQKDEFLAMLAHELRNPLAAIRNAVEIWKRPDASAAAMAEAQRILERQLQHQVRLVDDLIDVSRITRGLVTVKTEPVDLAQSIRYAIASVQAQADAARHRIAAGLPTEKVFVNGDPARLQQILANLLGNAIKYTPEEGHIDVTLERDGTEAVITVRDTGIGMSPELLGKAFGIFVQGEKSLDRSQGGLGVGLALVRRLAELHGGTVKAHSAGVGQGSTFVVRLPVLAQIRSTGDDEAAPAIARPRRVLVVDDNEDAASTMAMLLGLEGHEVSLANDGPSALRKIDAARPEAVLLDIGLPGMDGYEVCRRIRQAPTHAHVLLIAVTGYSSQADIRRALAAGFDGHLAKPASPAQITEAFLRHDRRSSQ